jgi:hypothetical protein
LFIPTIIAFCDDCKLSLPIINPVPTLPLPDIIVPEPSGVFPLVVSVPPALRTGLNCRVPDKPTFPIPILGLLRVL